MVKSRYCVVGWCVWQDGLPSFSATPCDHTTPDDRWEPVNSDGCFGTARCACEDRLPCRIGCHHITPDDRLEPWRIPGFSGYRWADLPVCPLPSTISRSRPKRKVLKRGLFWQPSPHPGSGGAGVRSSPTILRSRSLRINVIKSEHSRPPSPLPRRNTCSGRGSGKVHGPFSTPSILRSRRLKIKSLKKDLLWSSSPVPRRNPCP